MKKNKATKIFWIITAIIVIFTMLAWAVGVNYLY
jgi:hypothetical protein